MHIPVMMGDIEKFLQTIEPLDTIVDCTYGFGGHSNMMLKYCKNLIKLDRDSNVIKDNPTVINDCFSNIDKYVKQSDLVLADLGLSNMQIYGNKGFSFMNNNPIHMTMGLNHRDASFILNNYNFAQLVTMFKQGECKNSTYLAKRIIAFRLHTTIETVEHFKDAIEISNYKDLAKIFQAIRIEVNDELGELLKLIKIASKITKYLLIITFHSLEEKIITRNIPKNSYRVLCPSQQDIIGNPQSRSAKLFIIQY